MEVADWLVVLNQGRVEQAGPPTDLYDHPATEFVLRFLGPSTDLDGHAVRPHDLELVGPDRGRPGVVRDLLTLGFEIRVTVRLDDGQDVWLQVSRAELDALGVTPGDRVGVARRAGVETLPASVAPPTGEPRLGTARTAPTAASPAADAGSDDDALVDADAPTRS
jgi:sulfate transport system ATP-binding protein